MQKKIQVLLKKDGFSQQASSIARIIFGDQVEIFSGSVGDPLPDPVASGRTDLLLSFLSPWIVPDAVISRSECALNFHPGSTDYPGIGCYNFALFEEAKVFGTVCHHMLAKVDTGVVVEERLFPVLPEETVESLKYRTMVTMLSMFHDIATLIATGVELPVSDRQWSRRPFTRREMEELKRIEPGMTAEEIRRRIKATVYPGYSGPYTEVAGERFYASVPDRAPLA